MTAKTTITKDELTKALRTMSIHIGHDGTYGGSRHVDKATYPEALANDLFREVEKYREPLYQHDAVYADALGHRWLYDGTFKVWYEFGTAEYSLFDEPKRPLTKLMPEKPAYVLKYNYI
jgi:hypothetical protein